MFTNKTDFINTNSNDFAADLLETLFYALDDNIGGDNYISDYISEFADNNTSIYYHDILDFIKSDPEALADVVNEGLYEVRPGAEYDLYKHGQAAEFFRIERDIYDNQAEYFTAALIEFCDIMRRRENMPEMTEAEAKDLYNLVNNNINKWDRINDILIFAYSENLIKETKGA